MATIDPTRPTPSVLSFPPATDGASALDRLGHRVRAAWRWYLRSKLTRAMSQMSDRQLARIGLTRDDIPAHVRRIVPGGD